jgi:hypothetical protein
MKTVLRLNSSRSSQPPSNGNSPQLTPTLHPPVNAGAGPAAGSAYFPNGNGNGHGYHGPGPGHGSPLPMNGTIPAMGYAGYQTPTGR